MTLVELGQEIHARREAAALTLDDVALRIKVSPRTLQSIEAGAVELLPHTVYTKGFIRSFALIVGFPPAEITARLEEIFPRASLLEDAVQAKGIARLHAPPPSRRRKNILVLLFALCLLAGIGGGIYYVIVHHGATVWDFVKQPFSAITAPDAFRIPVAEATAEGARVSPQKIPPKDTPQIPAEEAAPAAPSAPEVSDAAPDGEISLPPALPGTTAEAAGQPSSLAPDSDLHKVEIRATQECWIRFRMDKSSGRGHFTLLPGRSRSFSFKNFLELQLGNAGGIRILYNDKDIGELGRPGEVRFVRFPDAAPARTDGR
jgi:cytoskeleton protein RodZ